MLEGKASTRPEILRLFWVHECNTAHVRPQIKIVAKTKIWTKGFVSKNREFKKRPSKLDKKWPSYAHLIFTRQSGIWPILCQLMAILAKCPEIWTSNLFSFDIQTNFEVNRSDIIPENHKNGHISKPNFAKVSFTKKPTPTFFNIFVWTFQNRCKYGFRKY